MTDMEQRARDQLQDLADTVPPSIHPRAELDRRLARQRKERWRAPALAAATAVVVAAVAIPLSMNNGGSGVDVGAAPTTATASDPPGSGQQETYELATSGGRRAVLVLGLDNSTWCLLNEFREEPGTECETLGMWPQTDPGSGAAFRVQTREVVGDDLPNAGSQPDMLLFVTAPEVTKLEVTGGTNAPVSVRQVAATETARYYLAEFPTSHQGFGYTATDANGNVVESAIT